MSVLDLLPQAPAQRQPPRPRPEGWTWAPACFWWDRTTVGPRPPASCYSDPIRQWPRRWVRSEIRSSPTVVPATSLTRRGGQLHCALQAFAFVASSHSLWRRVYGTVPWTMRAAAACVVSMSNGRQGSCEFNRYSLCKKNKHATTGCVSAKVI
jgi:hypothetical protein